MTTLSKLITPTDVATAENEITFKNKTIKGNENTLSDIPLDTAVTGVLPVAKGGTGATSLVGLLKGTGTSIEAVVSGTDIKTINGNNILGAGDITLGGAGVSSVDTAGSANGLSLSGGPITSTGTVTLSGTNYAAENVMLGNGTGAFKAVAPGSNGNVLTSNGTTWVSAPASGGGGNVDSVTASAPLASSGGANPNISLSGTVGVANGGTGLATPGASGNVLTSNGTVWISSPPAGGGGGTVTSVSGTGGYGGLNLSGNVTTSGSLTLSGTPTGTWPISITGNAATASNANTVNGYSIPAPSTSGNVLTSNGSSWVSSPAPGGGGGTVTSVSGTGGYGGLTLSGNVTSSGSLTLGGTPTGTWPISISGSASNASTVNGYSIPAPSSSGNVLTSNGSSWVSSPPQGGSGTVTSVSGTGTASGLTLSGTVTTSGNLTLSGTVNSLASGTYGINITGNAATVNGYSLPAPSSSGNVLTSNGSAWVSSPAPGGGGGSYVLVNTFSGTAASIDVTGLSSAYQGYVIYVYVSRPTTTTTLNCNLIIDGGPQGQYKYSGYTASIGNDPVAYSANNTGEIILSGTTGHIQKSIVYVNNPSETAFSKMISWNTVSGYPAGGSTSWATGAGGIVGNTNSPLTGIRFISPSGSASFTCYLYGIAKS